MAAPHSSSREKLVPVILAGGVGSRLWPRSRALFPKQLQAFFGDRSLLQNTLLRAAKISAQPPILVCNGAHRFAVAEQCRALGLPWRCIALEPDGRSTAPAIALAAHIACGDDPDAQLVVLPADHLIEDEDGFKRAVAVAAAAAAGQDLLLTFGVRPEFAETGYGYIELAAPKQTQPLRSPPQQRASAATTPPTAEEQVFAVRSFVEKPGLAAAQGFVESGRHLWNSGMFLFGAQTCLAEIEALNPKISQAVTAAHRQGRTDLDFFRPSDAFLGSPAASFDKAVLERTDKAAVLPVDIGWADIGSWRAVERAIPADANGNRIQGDVVALDAGDNLIQAQGRLVAVLGVEDLAIVETADAVLVAKRDRVQEVGALVDRLKGAGRKEYERHREVFRPWGSWQDLHTGPRFKVRRLKLKPGAGISLQRHRRRAEHWVVVQGAAEVTQDGETVTLDEHCGAQILQGSAHRLRNPGRRPLELVEVQVGERLDEDDIERLP